MRLKIFLTILLFLILSCNNVKASFFGYSIDEMDKKSDVIMIGRVLKSVGEMERKSFHYTVWQVKADYYIKGEKRDIFIKVATPGTKTFLTSVNYDLGDIGDYTLLFLNNIENDIFIPMSITGVATLRKELNGKYTVINAVVLNNDKLQSYINKSNLYSPKQNMFPIFHVLFVLLVIYFVLLRIKSKEPIKYT